MKHRRTMVWLLVLAVATVGTVSADEMATGAVDEDTAELFTALRRAAQRTEREAAADYATAPAAVDEARTKWAAGEYPAGDPPPTIQRGAEVWVPFGLEHPVLYCTQARACAAQLEPGEVVHHIQLGDDTHWVVEEGLLGDPDSPAPIVYFSPRIADIGTNAFIATTRRLYAVGLISPPIDELEAVPAGGAHYTRVLRFYYADGARSFERSLAEIRDLLRERALSERRAEEKEEAAATPTAATLPPRPAPVVSKDYRWKARPKKLAWEPTAVWDDGERTYIQLPEDYRSPVLPAIVVTVAGQSSVPNHHYDPDSKRFVVHQLIEEASLVVKHGPKRKQASWVRIERERKR